MGSYTTIAVSAEVNEIIEYFARKWDLSKTRTVEKFAKNIYKKEKPKTWGDVLDSLPKLSEETKKDLPIITLSDIVNLDYDEDYEFRK